LTSALDGSRWLTPLLGSLIPKERGLGAQWAVGKVGLRAGLDVFEKRKLFFLGITLCYDI